MKTNLTNDVSAVCKESASVADTEVHMPPYMKANPVPIKTYSSC